MNLHVVLEPLLIGSCRDRGKEAPARSTRYGQYPNVMFEIFNEPIFQNWTETIKPYHEGVVEALAFCDAMFCGLGFWLLGDLSLG